jgi:hypothetical protein
MSADGFFIRSMSRAEHAAASSRSASLAAISASPSLVGSPGVAMPARHRNASIRRAKYWSRRIAGSSTGSVDGGGAVKDGCACSPTTAVTNTMIAEKAG